MSLRRRKLVEEAFGWGKTIAGMTKVKVRVLRCVRHAFTFAMAAYKHRAADRSSKCSSAFYPTAKFN